MSPLILSRLSLLPTFTHSDEVRSLSFSTLGFPKLRLSLDRWLGVRSGDTATIKVSRRAKMLTVQVCIPGGACTTLWSGTMTVDTAWKRIIYGLPTAYCNIPAVEVASPISLFLLVSPLVPLPPPLQ